jgi:hypothetical protein
MKGGNMTKNVPDDPRSTAGRLLGPAAAELSCDQCFDMLDAYVELELAGAAADSQIPGMRPHLQGCAACRDDHDSLVALLLAGPGAAPQ